MTIGSSLGSYKQENWLIFVSKSKANHVLKFGASAFKSIHKKGTMTKCTITQQNKTVSFGLQGQLYWGGTTNFEISKCTITQQNKTEFWSPGTAILGWYNQLWICSPFAYFWKRESKFRLQAFAWLSFANIGQFVKLILHMVGQGILFGIINYLSYVMKTSKDMNPKPYSIHRVVIAAFPLNIERDLYFQCMQLFVWPVWQLLSSW